MGGLGAVAVVLLGCGAVLAIFLLGRELTCWYFKLSAALEHLSNIEHNTAVLVEAKKANRMADIPVEQPQQT